MKKLIAATVIGLAFLSNSSHAQNNLIIRGGSVLSTPKVDPELGDQSPKNGIFIGLGYEARVSDLIAFQPEVVYIQKGDKREILGTDFETRINYLEVPLLLKVKVPADKLLAYFNAGPSVGFGLSGEEEGYAFGIISGSRDIEFGDEAGEYKAIDVSAQLGGGLGYKIGKGAVLLDVRYGLGLTNLNNVNNREYKSRALTIGLGFSLPL